MRSIFIAWLVIAFFGTNSFSQIIFKEVIAASANQFKTTAYTLDFIVGESFTETLYNDKILTQGFFQPSIIQNTTFSNNISALQIAVFPNPFIERFNIDSQVNTDFTWRLSDLLGRSLLNSSEPIALRTSINTANLTRGSYMLEVFLDGSSFQTKLIKL